MQLYLHIPFCDSKCFYCGFNSYTQKSTLKKSYMIAILKQLKNDLKKFNIQKKSIKTIFIGGGTPSFVEASLYEDFFTFIDPFLKTDCEITTEANPNSLTKEWIEVMKSFGVNRVSVGVQSFDEKKLKFLGRAHSKKEAIKAIETLHDKDIKNISLDLIYGCSLDTKKLLKKDLEIAFSMNIDHLSCYSLTIEKDTKFINMPQVINDDEELGFWFIQKIQNMGLKQYEVSNFGKICKHNLGYWSYKEYLGVGCSSVGFINNQRYYPLHNIIEYIKNPLQKKFEKLTLHDIKMEKIFLGLRSIVGVEKNILDKDELNRANELVSEKKLIYKDNLFYNKNYFLSDEIALYLLGN